MNIVYAIYICKVHLMALEFKFFKYFLFKLICLTLNNRTAELYVDVTNINLEISYYNYTWRRLQLFTWRRLKLQKHSLQLHVTSTTTMYTQCRLQLNVTPTSTSRDVDYKFTWRLLQLHVALITTTLDYNPPSLFFWFNPSFIITNI